MLKLCVTFFFFFPSPDSPQVNATLLLETEEVKQSINHLHQKVKKRKDLYSQFLPSFLIWLWKAGKSRCRRKRIQMGSGRCCLKSILIAQQGTSAMQKIFWSADSTIWGRKKKIWWQSSSACCPSRPPFLGRHYLLSSPLAPVRCGLCPSGFESWVRSHSFESYRRIIHYSVLGDPQKMSGLNPTDRRRLIGHSGVLIGEICFYFCSLKLCLPVWPDNTACEVEDAPSLSTSQLNCLLSVCTLLHRWAH